VETPSIILKNICKKFYAPSRQSALTVFDGLNLEVRSGEILAIVGPSGCGKTTLLNIIALLESVDAGDVLINGTCRSATDVGKVSMGYLFQRDALLPWRSAWGNALLGVECRAAVSSRTEAAARTYFERFGLSGFEDAWPWTLSGGQRQRVALIQSLLIDPEFLLLDEPFGSLDYQTKLFLEEELLAVIRPNGGKPTKTVVLVTHDIEEAILLADRLLVLGHPGQGIVFEATIPLPDVMRSPVEARQSEAMSTLFRKVWGTLRACYGAERSQFEVRAAAGHGRSR